MRRVVVISRSSWGPAGMWSKDGSEAMLWRSSPQRSRLPAWAMQRGGSLSRTAQARQGRPVRVVAVQCCFLLIRKT